MALVEQLRDKVGRCNVQFSQRKGKEIWRVSTRTDSRRGGVAE